jgi:lysyl-tRNA synthetase class 2
LGNGYSELNDPIDQQARFQEQANLREAGDPEAQMHDQEFVEALEYGMPPTCGFGLSERLFSFLMNKPIRECVMFPLLRPKHEQSLPKKSKDTKIAVAIINTGVGLERWQEMNTVAHLNAQFGAHMGRSLFLQEQIQTADDESINLNIQHAILIKQIPSTEDLRSLRKEAIAAGVEIADFTREMLQTTDDRKVIAQTSEKSEADIEYLGLLVFGKKSEVDALTKQLDLFS